MAVEILTVTEVNYLALYDGTNGSEITDIFGVTSDSDNGSTLVFTEPLNFNEVTVQAGQYVIWYDVGGTIQVESTGVPANLLGTRYQSLNQEAPNLITGIGSETVSGTLLATADRQFDVTISPSMPDTSYTPRVWMSGGEGILGGHAITDVEVLNTTTVRVTLDSGAASPAGQVHVLALMLETS